MGVNVYSGLVAMKMTTASLLALPLIASLSGCYAGVGAGAMHAPGLLYNETKVPATHLAAQMDTDVVTKSGSAMCKSVLGLVSMGDCSVEAAKENGNISRVNNVEYNVKNLLGLYAEYTTKVYGQ
jgi:TRL-like protein family